MARRKSTIKVADIVADLNRYLATYDTTKHPVSRDYVLGKIAMVERILHDTGNYKGFRYLEPFEVPPNNKPGIFHTYDNGNRIACFPDDDIDDNRRYYHIF